MSKRAIWVNSTKLAILVTPMFQIINKSMKNSELCPLSGEKINEVYKHLMLG